MKMSEDEKIRALSGKYAVPILKMLRRKEWCIPAEVSRGLRIHATTAMKYLSKMYEIGLLDRRERRVRNVTTFEYRLKSSRIEVTLDIGTVERLEKDRMRDVHAFYLEMLSTLALKAERSGVVSIRKALAMPHGSKECGPLEDLLKTLAEKNFDAAAVSADIARSLDRKPFGDLRTVKDFYSAKMAAAIATCDSFMGSQATRRLLGSCSKLIAENDDLVRRLRLLEDVPEGYFGGE